MTKRKELTTEELAARWGISEGTLRNHRVFGTGPKWFVLPAFTFQGQGRKRLIRYRMADIRAHERDYGKSAR